MTDEVSNFMEAHIMVINYIAKIKNVTNASPIHFVVTRVNDGKKVRVPLLDWDAKDIYKQAVCDAFGEEGQTWVLENSLEYVGEITKDSRLFADLIGIR
jgi:hypothetical protein